MHVCISAQHVPSQGSRLLTYPGPSLYHMLPLVSTFTSQLYEWLWNYLCALLHPQNSHGMLTSQLLISF